MSGTVERPDGTDLRIVVWNCYGQVDRKVGRLLDAFSPDVLVVPESEPTPQMAQASLLAPAMSHQWVGDPGVPSKGLGVFASPTSGLTPLRSSEGLPQGLWLATQVHAPWPLTVVGAVMRPHPEGRRGWPTEYMAAAAEMLDHLDDVLVAGPAVVAGDFNFSAQSSGSRVGTIFERFRERYGLRSAFHDFFDVAPGDESQMTLSWRWNRDAGYHCDLVFVPDALEILGVHVGTYLDWTAEGVAGRSDHVPVVVDLRVR